jgi:ABC-type uncharacterized transport system substrate-binding protein
MGARISDFIVPLLSGEEKSIMKNFMRVAGCVLVLLGLLTNVGFAADMKHVILLETDMQASLIEDIQKGLEQEGFVSQENMTLQKIVVSPADDVAQLVARVQEAAPDLILTTVEFGNVLAALKGLAIPVVTRLNVEPYIDAKGMPTSNITGLYGTLQDMLYNGYKFLQQVAPLKAGQSVVVLDNPEFPILPKADVIDALERLHIPLKAVVTAPVYEDWQAAVLQYNDDPEVGWMLRTVPTRTRDGSRLDMAGEFYPWYQQHFKKPTITYWENAVRDGTLCAFGIDMNAASQQFGRMGARVLQGEDVRTINAEYPHIVNIALNRKTATELGIVFSLDVLKLANTIYDDYEGKQVIRK